MDSKSTARLAATAEIGRGGVVLMVGLGGRLGVLCAGAVIDAGFRGVAIATVAEAIHRIPKLAPKIVVLPGTLTRGERRELLAAAREADAEIVELPSIVEPAYIAHAVERTVARLEARRVDGRAAAG